MLDGLIDKLGIPEVKAKIKSGGPGASAKLLSRGEVDFVVSGLPPLLGTPNIEWLGYLPEEINKVAAVLRVACRSTPSKPKRVARCWRT